MAPIGPWRSTRTLELDVLGIRCSHCQATVETVLGDVEGVRSVDIDEGSAHVEADEDVSRPELVDTLQAVGFDCRPNDPNRRRRSVSLPQS